MNKYLLVVLFGTVVIVNTFICVLVIAAAKGGTGTLTSYVEPKKSEVAVSVNNDKTDKQVLKDTVTISFVGDCTLGSFRGSDNQFGKYYINNGADYFFSNVHHVFAADDITFINLEGALTAHHQEVDKEYSIRGEPWYVNILKSSSVELCNLANNHIMDCGQQGVADTVSLLGQNGINYCGVQNVSAINKNGIIVCFLGYNGWENSEPLRSQIAGDIKLCREKYKADIVCVEFHWGVEREYYPTMTQKELGHFVVDSGADCVVGSHPHVVQGIEKYHGKVIAYSLGNFCFGANNNPVDKDSFILQQTFKRDGTVVRTEVVPCRISSRTDINDFRPTVLSGNEGFSVVNRLKVYSQPFAGTIDVLR